MKETARYISIEQVVQQYINEAHLTDAAFERLWHIAIRGLEDFHYSFAAEPITRKLNVLPNKTVELPDDYVDWCKIGVLNEEGEVASLKISTNLSRYAATSADRVASNPAVFDRMTVEDNFFRNYNYDGAYVTLYGVTSGLETVGICNVLNDEGIIILGHDYAYDHVILEYIASPVANQDYLMPVLLREALISWLRWNDRRSIPAGRRSNLGQRQMDRKDYFNDRRLGKQLVKRFRLEEANDVIRLNSNMKIKA